MDLDQPDVVAVADAAEGRDEVPRLDRAAGPSGEDQARIRPGPAQVGLVAGLLGSLCTERLTGEVESGRVRWPACVLTEPSWSSPWTRCSC